MIDVKWNFYYNGYAKSIQIRISYPFGFDVDYYVSLVLWTPRGEKHLKNIGYLNRMNHRILYILQENEKATFPYKIVFYRVS